MCTHVLTNTSTKILTHTSAKILTYTSTQLVPTHTLTQIVLTHTSTQLILTHNSAHAPTHFNSARTHAHYNSHNRVHFPSCSRVLTFRCHFFPLLYLFFFFLTEQVGIFSCPFVKSTESLHLYVWCIFE